MSGGLRPLSVPIADSTQIAEARRAAAAMAGGLGYGERDAGNLSIAVTEAATNVLRHGGGGHVLLRALPGDGGAAGVEILAVDKGPGMHNVADSMRDGHSTIGTAGTGLGAMARLTHNLEVWSSPGKGTALRFEAWNGAPAPRDGSAEFGVICLPIRGEEVAGDGWLYERNVTRSLLAVVDGLGHGPDAALAAHAALETFARRSGDTPAGMMDMAHAALRPTRGAAAAVAAWDPVSGRGQFCGVGNINAVVIGQAGQRSLVSHNGTLGHSARTMTPFDFELPAAGLLVMHSDGLGTRWSLDNYPGLRARHPALIAAVLWRDYERGRDDATIAVVRRGT